MHIHNKIKSQSVLICVRRQTDKHVRYALLSKALNMIIIIDVFALTLDSPYI